MADENRQNTPSDDVELEDILHHSDIPTVIVRKGSEAGGDEDEDDKSGGIKAMTPAPMASFEALSDVDESEPDTENGSAGDSEALRELATSLDIPTSRSQQQQQTRSRNKDVAGLERLAGTDRESSTGDLNGSAGGVPMPPPPSPLTTAEDNQRISEENEDEGEGTDTGGDEDILADKTAAFQTRSSPPAETTVNIPTLVFDDFDEGATGEDEEEVEEIDDTRNVVAAASEQTWGWPTDTAEEGSWVTFAADNDSDDDRPAKSKSQPAPIPTPAEAVEQPAEKPSRPPPPVSKPVEKPASRHPEIISTDPDHPAIVLESEDYLDDDDLDVSEKKKSKIKLSFKPKNIIKNITSSAKKDKSKDKTGKENTEKSRKQDDFPPTTSAGAPSGEVQPRPQPNMESEEWKAFQAMQDRISQVVSKTSEKVSQLEQGFETELSKLNAEAAQAASPWVIIGATDTSSGSGGVPAAKSPEKEENKASWVGFDDTFDVDAAAAIDVQQSDANGSVNAADKLVVLDSTVTETNIDVEPPKNMEDDVVQRHFSELADEPMNQNGVDEENGNVGDPFVVESSTVEEESRKPETNLPTEPEEVHKSENQEPENPEQEIEDEDAVDPFDVSNLVTAISSGKPLFEVIAEEDKLASRSTKKTEAKSMPQKPEPIVTVDGVRARPRPRPQAVVKSANPFKIALVATSIGSVDDSEPAAKEEEDYQSTFTTGVVSTTSANPFSRTDAEESGGNDWDPFSGEDLSANAANDDADRTDMWTKPSTEEPFTTTTLESRHKDTDSRSSNASLNEPDEPLPPLDPFYPKWDGTTGWMLYLRTPLKKKLTKNRSWKPVFVRLSVENDATRLRVYSNDSQSVCLHELSLGPAYHLRKMELQQFDQYSKCHTVKLQHVMYIEKIGLKSDRIAPTLRDVTKVRDLKGLKDLMHKPKATMVLSHSPQALESLKFGTLDYVSYKQFIRAVEDVMFVQKIPPRGKVSTSYTKDEIIVDLVDDYYADIDFEGHITYHKARVRLFCLAFLNGSPTVEVGINDKKRRGNEIVRREDIVPIKTEDWITYEEVELHKMIDPEEYEKTRLIKFVPPDACRFELMRFRVRPRVNVELPLQIAVQMSTSERTLEIRADVMIPGYFSTSRRASQIPCEDIQIRFPIPESLVYMFRVEKRFRYGSIHSAKKKPGKIKGLERLTMFATGHGSPTGGSSGAAAGSTPIVLEASTGLAKYEHVFRSVVWRISRLPERNQGAYKTHLFTLKLELGAHDTPPTEYAKHVYVEYSMTNSMVSRAQVRSVSFSGQYYEEPPDRWVRHLAHYEYTVEIEQTDRVRAPTHTEVPDMDVLGSAIGTVGGVVNVNDDDEGMGIGGAVASGGDSTAEDDSDSSSDSD